jgi:hypothetical protein
MRRNKNGVCLNCLRIIDPEKNEIIKYGFLNSLNEYKILFKHPSEVEVIIMQNKKSPQIVCAWFGSL